MYDWWIMQTVFFLTFLFVLLKHSPPVKPKRHFRLNNMLLGWNNTRNAVRLGFVINVKRSALCRLPSRERARDARERERRKCSWWFESREGCGTKKQPRDRLRSGWELTKITVLIQEESNTIPPLASSERLEKVQKFNQILLLTHLKFLV